MRTPVIVKTAWTTRRRRAGRYAGSRCWRIQAFYRQAYFPAFINRKHLNFDAILLFQKVTHIAHIYIRNLRNVDEAHFAFRQLNKCAEVSDTCDHSFNHAAYFDGHTVICSPLNDRLF